MMFEFKPKHDDEDGGQADITTLEYRLAVKQTSPLRSTHWQSSKPHHFGEQTGSQANIAISEYRLVANAFYSYEVGRSHSFSVESTDGPGLQGL